MSAWQPTDEQTQAALQAWLGADWKPDLVKMPIEEMRRALLAGVGAEVSELCARAGMAEAVQQLYCQQVLNLQHDRVRLRERAEMLEGENSRIKLGRVQPPPASVLAPLAAEFARITAAAQAEVVELRAKLADCEAQHGPGAADLWHANRLERDRLFDAEKAARAECAAMRSERDALRAQCGRPLFVERCEFCPWWIPQINFSQCALSPGPTPQEVTDAEGFAPPRDCPLRTAAILVRYIEGRDELPADALHSEPPSPPLVPPGVTIRLAPLVATEYTRVRKLHITDAERWQVDGVDVGNRAELVGTISAAELMRAVGTEVTWDVPPGSALIMRLRNVIDEPQPEPTITLGTVGVVE